jgi:hypothetical protein
VLLSLVVGVCLGETPRPASAHEGHDHDATMAAPPGVSLSPRLVARSDDYELVGVARGRTLSIYLDRSVDNAPVIGAKLDLEVDGQTMSATAEPSGIYTLTADWVGQAGRHDVIVTIIAEQGADLLAGTIEVPAAPAAASPLGKGGALQAPSADNILAFLLGMLATVALRRRSSFFAIVRGAADRVRAGGKPIVANMVSAANRGLGNVNARLQQARSVAPARFFSGGALRGLPLRPRRPSLGGLDRVPMVLRTKVKALRDRFDRTVRAPLDAGLRSATAKLRNSELRRLRRVLAAVTPLRPWPVAGRFEAATVAVICLVAIVAIALLLFGRGVLAHEGHDQAPAAGPAPAVVTATSAAAAATPGGAAATGDVDSGPRRLLDGSLFVPKASQRLLNVRTVVSRNSEVGRTVRMVGQVIADPGTSGEIHASIRGRLEPYRGAWPKVGQKVEVGDVLAWVVPVVNPIDRGIILQQLAQIDHEIALTQERLSGPGSAKGANPGTASRELDDARSDLANLVRRREAIASVIRDRDTLRAPLLAPSTGIVAASFAAAGQIVDEQQKLFTVVDLKRLWVEAYAYDTAAIGNVLDANAQGPTGGNYHLKFISRGPQLQRQTIPLYFQLDNPDTAVSVGSLVSVLVETGGERSGVILPRAAVTRNTSGQDIVWQHAYPESFVPIPVRTESIDGSNVLIAAGVVPDMRVVVEAADLLNEVR